MDDSQELAEEQGIAGAACTPNQEPPDDQTPLWRRLLINQNPFYLVSAALVLFGMSAGFGTDDIWINTTIPLTIMLTYAAALSGIAVLLIRRGQVWEDVRTILLALGILFFNVSAALDELMVRETEGAQLTVVAVWLLVPALVELLRRGLGIRWPLSLSLAFHGSLALLLVYPALTAHFLLAKAAVPTAWSLIAFPLVAGLAVLSLLPAVRKLARAPWDNGTPWWGLELIVVLALPLAFLARTYLLSTAFYPFPSLATGGYSQLETAFGGWCCVPVLLAALALLLEFGIVRQRAWCRRVALFSAPLLVPLAMLGPSGSSPFIELRNMLTSGLASPVLIAAAAIVLFAAVACVRRVPEAWPSLFASVLMLSPIGGETVNWQSLQTPSWLPMALVAAGAFAALVKYRHSLCFMGGWLAALASLATLTDALRGAWLTVAVTHLLLLGMILSAVFFRDVLARAVALTLTVCLPSLLLPALWLSGSLGLPDPGLANQLLYASMVFALCHWLYGQLQRSGFRLANQINAAHLGVFLLAQIGIFLQDLEFRGSWRIVAGIATLGLAVWISWYKGQSRTPEAG